VQERLPTQFVWDIPYLACPITRAGKPRPWAKGRPELGSSLIQGLVHLLAKRLAEGESPENGERVVNAYRRALVNDLDEAAYLISKLRYGYNQRQISYILFVPIEPGLAIQHYAARRKADWFAAAAYSLTEWEYDGVVEDARALIRDAHHVLDEDGDSLSQTHWGQLLIRWLKRRDREQRERTFSSPVSFAGLLKD